MITYFYLYLFAAGNSPIKPGGLPDSSTDAAKVQVILNIVLGIFGAIALLMLVISGLRYITSGGDPGNTAKAKDGIIYSLIGLLIALIAEGIVAFVVGNL